MTSARSNVFYAYDALDRITQVCYGSCPTSGGGGGGSTASVGITAGSGLDCAECGGSGPVPDRAPEDNPPPPADTFTAWTYDPVGNRLTETNYLGTTTYAYDAADRLLSVTGPGTSPTVPYTYDRNGNQTAAGAATFSYDLADRLVSATVGTKTETYTWSGDGVRLSATSSNGPGGTVRFGVDRSFGLPELVIERDGNGKLVRRYSYGLDLLAQTTPTKGPYWYHHDGLGSVTDVTSATGSSLWWAEYSPFGTPSASGSTSQAPVNLFRFTGAYFDTVTALYHLRARQYDPTSGRFLSTDPVSPSLSNPSIGTYVYVGNNPVNRVDPSGRCLQSLALALLGPGGAVAGGGLTAGCAVALLLGSVAISTTTYVATQGVPEFPTPDLLKAPDTRDPIPGPVPVPDTRAADLVTTTLGPTNPDIGRREPPFKLCSGILPFPSVSEVLNFPGLGPGSGGRGGSFGSSGK